MDYSKLSNEDLIALKNGDYSKVSDEGLLMLKQESAQTSEPVSSEGNLGEAARMAVDSALPAPLKLAKQLASTSPDTQRGVMTTAAGLMPGAAGVVLPPVAGGAIDLANSPKAREIMAEGAMDVVKGNIPGAISKTVGAIEENPEAVKEFGKRRATEAAAGLVGGALAKGAKAVSGAIKSVGTGGPFTMALENPSLVRGSVREKILKELAKSEEIAMKAEVKETGQLANEATRLIRWSQTAAGRRKLAEEAVDVVNKGGDISTQSLLAYEKALGDVASDGQFGSKVYMETRDRVLDLLKKQAPNVAKNKAEALKVFMAEGKAYGKYSDQFGKLVQKLPFVGPMTRATVGSPLVRRAAGAATRGAFESARPLSQAVAAGINSNRQEFNIGNELDKAFNRRKKRG